MCVSVPSHVTELVPRSSDSEYKRTLEKSEQFVVNLALNVQYMLHRVTFMNVADQGNTHLFYQLLEK